MKRITQIARAGSRGYKTKGSRPNEKLSRTPKGSLLSPQTRVNRSVARPPATPRLPESNRQVGPARPQPNEHHEPPKPPSSVALVSSALAEQESSDLVAPVRIPDDPDGVLDPSHPAMAILNHSSLVIQRQIEMMNVMLGFEQANRYVIMDGKGETVGYLAERDHGIGSTMARQAFKTHRSFTSHIFDKDEREVLRIHRPFAWLNSRIRIYDPITGATANEETSSALQGMSASSVSNPTATTAVSNLPLSEMRIIGEAQQQWAPLRRKYDLFTYRPLGTQPSDSATATLTSGDVPNIDTKALTVKDGPSDAEVEAGMSQFAHVNEPFLSWDFTLRNEESNQIGSVNRSFGGFAREIFTDTGVYALRMDSASMAQSSETQPNEAEQEATALTLDQRAVMLATAVSIDFDYFSRHSHAGGGGMGFMPLWFPGMGGGAAEGGAAGGAVGGAAGEAGVAEGAAGAVGNAARGVGGAGEGAIAGAGTMAGYEAMQRGRESYEQRQPDDASPTNNAPASDDTQQGGPRDEHQPGEEVWGAENDGWLGGEGDNSPGGSSGGDGEGGGLMSSIWDSFFD